MTEILIEAAKQVPALAVLVWIVARFLSFLSEMSQRNSASMAKLAEAIDHLKESMLSK